MKRKRITTILTLGLMLLTLPILALAQASDVSTTTGDQNTYTLEQMLNNAIQDEYKAQATYQMILTAYGDNNAFANIAQAEASHIAELTVLFQANGFAVPADTAATQVTLPVDMEAAYAAGVTAESNNITMYAAFLSQTNLPQDVRDTFTELQNASENHLSAFTHNLDREGNGQGMGNNRDEGTTTWGNAQGIWNGNTDTQGNSDTCMDDTQRMGMNRRSDVVQGNSKNQRNSNNDSQTVCDGTCDGTYKNNGGVCDGTCDTTVESSQP